MAKDVAEQGSLSAKDYHDPPQAALVDVAELSKWSFYRALIAEFIATLLFLYITVLTVIGHKSHTDLNKPGADQCGGVGLLGIAWAFGGMIFVLVYCTAGISGIISLDNVLLDELKTIFLNSIAPSKPILLNSQACETRVFISYHISQQLSCVCVCVTL